VLCFINSERQRWKARQMTQEIVRIQLDMPRFTKSNTTHEDWAELGSVFKAMSVKTSLWFFCLKAAAFSAARPEEHDWNF